MALAMQEFYEGLRTIALSAFTSQGMDELEDVLAATREEFFTSPPRRRGPPHSRLLLTLHSAVSESAIVSDRSNAHLQSTQAGKARVAYPTIKRLCFTHFGL